MQAIIPTIIVSIAVIIWYVILKADNKPLKYLGLTVILLAVPVIVGITYGHLQRLNYNAWYGTQTKDLLEVTIEKLEKGETEQVIQELKTLKENYKPTYENKANYDELVKETIEKLKEERKPNQKVD